MSGPNDLMDGVTPGPWFVSGVRFIMNGGEWHSVLHYNEATKQDEHVACVGYDPRDGAGLADARLIAAAPTLAAKNAALIEALENIRWKSDDKDNMEFAARITYVQMDAIRAALAANRGEAG